MAKQTTLKRSSVLNSADSDDCYLFETSRKIAKDGQHWDVMVNVFSLKPSGKKAKKLLSRNFTKSLAIPSKLVGLLIAQEMLEIALELGISATIDQLAIDKTPLAKE